MNIGGAKKSLINNKFVSGKCYIYIRVSRIMQVDGDSLDHQEGVCREFAQKNNLDVVSVFADKGVSGQKSGRKEFNMLKEKVERGDTIIAYSISRLSRSLNDLLDLISECESKGVILKSLKEDIATDSPYSMFMTTLMASMAELEANLTRERVSDISRRKRQRGETYARQPYGYVSIIAEKGKPKRLIPHLEEQLKINKMFELRTKWIGTISRDESIVIQEDIDRNINEKYSGKKGTKEENDYEIINDTDGENGENEEVISEEMSSTNNNSHPLGEGANSTSDTSKNKYTHGTRKMKEIHVGELNDFLEDAENSSAIRKVGFTSLSNILEREGILTRGNKKFSVSSLFYILLRENTIRKEKHGTLILSEERIKEYIDLKMPLIVPYDKKFDYIMISESGPTYNGLYVDDDIILKKISYASIKNEHKTEARKYEKENDTVREQFIQGNDLILTKKELLEEKKYNNLSINIKKALKHQSMWSEETEKRRRIELMQDEDSFRQIFIRTFDAFKEKINKKNDAIIETPMNSTTNKMECQKIRLPAFERKKLSPKPEPNNRERKKIELKYKIYTKNMLKHNPDYNENDDPDALEMQLQLLELEELE